MLNNKLSLKCRIFHVMLVAQEEETYAGHKNRR